jgi:hypothetical protein
LFLMENTTLQAVSAVFGWRNPEPTPIVTGLINHTWKVKEASGTWLLQRINTGVFTQPEKIDDNLRRLAEFLSVHEPDYLFTALVPDQSGNTLVRIKEDSYRVFRWIEGTHTMMNRQSLKPLQPVSEILLFGCVLFLLQHCMKPYPVFMIWPGGFLKWKKPKE